MKRLILKISWVYQKTFGRLGLLGIIIFLALLIITGRMPFPFGMIFGLALSVLAIGNYVAQLIPNKKP